MKVYFSNLAKIKLLMKLLLKYLLSKPSDLWLLFKTFTLLALIRLGLWRLSFARLRKVVAFLSQTKIFSSKDDSVSIDKLVWAVNRSTHYMPGNAKCLARALTTEILMNQYGYDPKLCIGVAKEPEGELKAHAWIESQGKVIMGQLKELSMFKALPLSQMKTKQ